jgi:hypothetical protein
MFSIFSVEIILEVFQEGALLLLLEGIDKEAHQTIRYTNEEMRR